MRLNLNEQMRSRGGHDISRIDYSLSNIFLTFRSYELYKNGKTFFKLKTYFMAMSLPYLIESKCIYPTLQYTNPTMVTQQSLLKQQSKVSINWI